MAVSRGGGFSGGGGHSFSSRTHSGKSGKGAGAVFSTHPFAGAIAYTYINRKGRERCFYSSTVPKRQGKAGTIILTLFLTLALIGMSCLIFFAIIPSKLSSWACDAAEIYLNDRAGIVSHTEDFNVEMRAFYEKTGIEPYLYTLPESEFPSQVYGELSGDTLISFALDEYYALFGDEGHYLLVVVKLRDGEYIWCEAAGDISAELIDGEAFKSFQVNMLRLTRESNVGEVIADSLSQLSSEVFTITANDKFALAMVCVATLALGALIATVLISSLRRIKMMNEYCDYKRK